MGVIIKKGRKLPPGYLEEATEEVYRIYHLEEVAGEDLKQAVDDEHVKAELVKRYFEHEEEGLYKDAKLLAREVFERSFKKLSSLAENKMINFIKQNYEAYDYNDILSKIKDYVPTQKNLSDGVTKIKLTEANLQLSKFMNAYEEFINWIKSDPANYKAVAVIGNYFMGIKNLFNDTDS